MTSRMRSFILVIVGLTLSHAATAGLLAAAHAAPQEQLREWVERVEETHNAWASATPVAAAQILAKLYRRREFELLWQNPTARAQLLATIVQTRDDGLDPHDYHLNTVARSLGDLSQSPDVQADIVLSDALLRLLYHYKFGKVDAANRDAAWTFNGEANNLDLVMMAERAAMDGTIPQLLAAFTPQHRLYQNLRRVLAAYRRLQKRGEWPTIPDGPRLAMGSRDIRITALRERLRFTGELGDQRSGDETFFDGETDSAVKRFQRRHGLWTDGVVGPQTLQELNVPLRERVDTLRVNLERGRWVLREVPADFLLVDIAAFQAELLHDEEVVWRSRIVVGQPYRSTPVFRSAIAYLVFNPSWTIPPTILREDILPAVKADPSYLSKQHIGVFDDAGRAIDPQSIPWNRFSGPDVPFQLRQDASPDNPLGRVKFMLPNPYMVYLHDTPARSLFERPVRTFSSGCIRVEKSAELARMLLDDPRAWSAERIAATIASGETRTVPLPRPQPILLVYWTAVAGAGDEVSFRRDIYHRDEAVMSALEQPFLPEP